jgi:hypothetical protein
MADEIVIRKRGNKETRFRIVDSFEQVLISQIEKLAVLANGRILDRAEASLLKTLLEVFESLPEDPADTSSDSALKKQSVKALLQIASKQL